MEVCYHYALWFSLEGLLQRCGASSETAHNMFLDTTENCEGMYEYEDNFFFIEE